VLSSLLPGLRQLRAPLVSGALLLAAIALFVHSHFRGVTEKRGRSESLESRLEWIGRPGLVAAALLGSYLVGSVLTSSVRDLALAAYDKSLLATAKALRTRHLPYSAAATSRLLGELLRTGKEDPEVEAAIFDSELQLKLWREGLTDGGRRLIVANAELFGDYDRLQSEAELRDALMVPIPLIVAAVFFNTDVGIGAMVGVAVVVLVLLAVLYRQARRLDRAAFDTVLYAVADHIIGLPSLDRFSWVRQ
jgi:hypothetical protein